VLRAAITGIAEVIFCQGLVNVDFADVRTVMRQSGRALLGTGEASGERKAIRAAEQALTSPLLEQMPLAGATGLLINLVSGPELALHELNEALVYLQQAVHEEATIIFGQVVDTGMEDRVRITVIATGLRAAE
jgi:cell division protein FtsZ